MKNSGKIIIFIAFLIFETIVLSFSPESNNFCKNLGYDQTFDGAYTQFFSKSVALGPHQFWSYHWIYKNGLKWKININRKEKTITVDELSSQNIDRKFKVLFSYYKQIDYSRDPAIECRGYMINDIKTEFECYEKDKLVLSRTLSFNLNNTIILIPNIEGTDKEDLILIEQKYSQSNGEYKRNYKYYNLEEDKYRTGNEPEFMKRISRSFYINAIMNAYDEQKKDQKGFVLFFTDNRVLKYCFIKDKTHSCNPRQLLSDCKFDRTTTDRTTTDRTTTARTTEILTTALTESEDNTLLLLLLFILPLILLLITIFCIYFVCFLSKVKDNEKSKSRKHKKKDRTKFSAKQIEMFKNFGNQSKEESSESIKTEGFVVSGKDISSTIPLQESTTSETTLEPPKDLFQKKIQK